MVRARPTFADHQRGWSQSRADDSDPSKVLVVVLVENCTVERCVLFYLV